MIATGRAYARAALVGNPSDGYGGAVLAITIRDFRAEVDLAYSNEPVIDAEASALIEAAVARFEASLSPTEQRAYRAACRTTIPRQVGLAGSSAILVATLRALCELHGTVLDPDRLAELSFRAETEDIGYPAGGQDPYAQAHEGLVLMDFAADGVGVERLDPSRLPRLFLAYRTDAWTASESVHADLRSQIDRDGGTIGLAMSEMADLAREAGRRLRAGRGAEIGELMSATFDLRRRIIDLDARHERMVDLARDHDAHANFTGSGGAILGTVPPADAWPALRSALEEDGCEVIELRVG